MLSYVLDENISPIIADQVTHRRPDIGIQSIFRWRGGALLNQPDQFVLQAAAEDHLTLVTYDCQTIPPLLIAWAASGLDHGGVLFIDQRTIRSDDFGRLVRALEQFWDREHREDWTNRMDYLGAP